jgi:hypothetical protein
MGAPHLFQISELVEFATTVNQRHPQAGLIPMRPMCWPGLALKRRLKVAWGVFTGKYDAVFWEPTFKQPWKKEDNSDLNTLLAKAAHTARGEALPSQVDLRQTLLPVQDQGELNASSACAITAAVAATGMEGDGILPYLYYNERTINGHDAANTR